MAIKKSELYSSLWKSCDQLRGGMDVSQYKDYVLVLLFVKYVSDRYAGQKDALIEVPPGGSFADIVALKGDKEIGDKLNKIIGRLAEANKLKGVIDVADEARSNTGLDLALYGQENDNATAALAKMNMILHLLDMRNLSILARVLLLYSVNGRNTTSFD